MGTPNFALSILQKIHVSSFCEIVAVYTQPDRPAGRGKKLTPSAVKIYAEEHGFSVLQPFNFNKPEDVETLKNLQPDVLVVAAYGIILPQEILDIPKIAPINIHASLLPKYRGAAPVQRAIMNMDEVSGVSIMKMERGLDTGPIYSLKEYELQNLTLTSEKLLEELAVLGADELLCVLHSFYLGEKLQTLPQDNIQSCYAAKLQKNEGIIDWSKTAKEVHAQIRAVIPWPSPKVYFTNSKLQAAACTLGVGRIGSEICDFDCIANEAVKPKTGEFWSLRDGTFAIATLDRWYILDAIRPVGKRQMNIKDFVNGYFEDGIVPSFSFSNGKNSLSPLDRVLSLSEIEG